jgi:hypothetical protein
MRVAQSLDNNDAFAVVRNGPLLGSSVSATSTSIATTTTTHCHSCIIYFCFFVFCFWGFSPQLPMQRFCQPRGKERRRGLERLASVFTLDTLPLRPHGSCSRRDR